MRNSDVKLQWNRANYTKAVMGAHWSFASHVAQYVIGLCLAQMKGPIEKHFLWFHESFPLVRALHVAKLAKFTVLEWIKSTMHAGKIIQKKCAAKSRMILHQEGQTCEQCRPFVKGGEQNHKTRSVCEQQLLKRKGNPKQIQKTWDGLHTTRMPHLLLSQTGPQVWLDVRCIVLVPPAVTSSSVRWGIFT